MTEQELMRRFFDDPHNPILIEAVEALSAVRADTGAKGGRNGSLPSFSLPLQPKPTRRPRNPQGESDKRF